MRDLLLGYDNCVATKSQAGNSASLSRNSTSYAWRPIRGAFFRLILACKTKPELHLHPRRTLLAKNPYTRQHYTSNYEFIHAPLAGRCAHRHAHSQDEWVPPLKDEVVEFRAQPHPGTGGWLLIGDMSDQDQSAFAILLTSKLLFHFVSRHYQPYMNTIYAFQHAAEH